MKADNRQFANTLRGCRIANIRLFLPSCNKVSKHLSKIKTSMVKEKVGRSDWKQLKVGETGVYTLPDERAVESARVAAQDVKKYDHYEFERIKVAEPLTIAFKRTK